jgi:hypothetical protein
MARPRAALTLTDMTATRGSSASTASPAATSKDARARRGQTLRLEPEAWRQLKMLAITEGKTSHDLLIEAVNLLFDHYNRPTIAG